MGPSDLEAELLAEVYARPDDDAPRGVLADHLIERGDPRGELIALQLDRHRRADPVVTDREQQLLDDGWDHWVDPGVHVDQVGFARGMWARLSAMTHQVADPHNPVLGTVAELRVSGASPLASLLDGPLARSLRVLTISDRDQLAPVLARAHALALVCLDWAFDVGNHAPAIDALSPLHSLRELRIHTLGELGHRWVERVVGTTIRKLVVSARSHTTDITTTLDCAASRGLAAIELQLGFPQVDRFQRTGSFPHLHAERTSRGFEITRVELAAYANHSHLVHTRRLLDELSAFDRGDIKLTMPVITAPLAEQAHALGLTLVAHATDLMASPRHAR